VFQQIVGFIWDLLRRTLTWAFVAAMLVLPFAAVMAAMADKHQFELTFALTMMGTIVGALLGAGSTFVDWFSDPEYTNSNGELRHATLPLRWGLRATLGPLGAVLGMAYLLSAKDDTQARPGRGRRALIGAVVGAVFGIGFAVLTEVNSFHRTSGWSFGGLTIVALIGAMACGLAGLLSDAL